MMTEFQPMCRAKVIFVSEYPVLIMTTSSNVDSWRKDDLQQETVFKRSI
jgi:hypothetical protein